MLLRAVVLGLVVSGAAFAQQMVPAHKGSCPSGASHAGSGYCRSSSGAGFVAAQNGSCPSGTSHAGAGYCRTDGRSEYVPSRGGSCPSGTSHAGAGYCKGR
jgi:type IV secretory pathway TrbL component